MDTTAGSLAAFWERGVEDPASGRAFRAAARRWASGGGSASQRRVLVCLASHPSLDPEERRFLLRHARAEVKVAACERADTTAAELREAVARDRRATVCESVALHSSCPSDLLEELGGHPSVRVRTAALVNPAAGDALVLTIMSGLAESWEQLAALEQEAIVEAVVARRHLHSQLADRVELPRWHQIRFLRRLELGDGALAVAWRRLLGATPLNMISVEDLGVLLHHPGGGLGALAVVEEALATLAAQGEPCTLQLGVIRALHDRVAWGPDPVGQVEAERDEERLAEWESLALRSGAVAQALLANPASGADLIGRLIAQRACGPEEVLATLKDRRARAAGGGQARGAAENLARVVDVALRTFPTVAGPIVAAAWGPDGIDAGAAYVLADPSLSSAAYTLMTSGFLSDSLWAEVPWSMAQSREASPHARRVLSARFALAAQAQDPDPGKAQAIETACWERLGALASGFVGTVGELGDVVLVTLAERRLSPVAA